MTEVQGTAIAPEGIRVANPAFDVTPNRYVSAIITERGVARAPFDQSLKKSAARGAKGSASEIAADCYPLVSLAFSFSTTARACWRLRVLPFCCVVSITAVGGALALHARADLHAPGSLTAILKSELDREFGILKAKADPAPYYMGYEATEEQTDSVSASLGALIEDVHAHRRASIRRSRKIGSIR